MWAPGSDGSEAGWPTEDEMIQWLASGKVIAHLGADILPRRLQAIHDAALELGAELAALGSCADAPGVCYYWALRPTFGHEQPWLRERPARDFPASASELPIA